MLRFKQYLTNSEKPRKIGIYVGRFQPMTRAHQKLIEHLKSISDEVFVGIVEGDNSKRKTRNFLSFEERKELFESIIENVNFVKTNSGFIPGFIKHIGLQKQNENVEFFIIAGDDRINTYQRQFEKLKYNVTLVIKERDKVSGTATRKALKSNNYNDFKAMVAGGLDTEDVFNSLRERLMDKLRKNGDEDL